MKKSDIIRDDNIEEIKKNQIPDFNNLDYKLRKYEYPEIKGWPQSSLRARKHRLGNYHKLNFNYMKVRGIIPH